MGLNSAAHKVSAVRLGRETAGWHSATGLPYSCTPHSQPRPWRYSGNTSGLSQLFSQLCRSAFRPISYFLQCQNSQAKTPVEGLTAGLSQCPTWVQSTPAPFSLLFQALLERLAEEQALLSPWCSPGEHTLVLISSGKSL